MSFTIWNKYLNRTCSADDHRLTVQYQIALVRQIIMILYK